MIHRVAVYLRGNVMAHVQSTNGHELPGPVRELDKNGVETPLRRIELEIEATPEEVEQGTNGQPRHRKASALFRDELEYDAQADRIRYRAGAGRDGAITVRLQR